MVPGPQVTGGISIENYSVRANTNQIVVEFDIDNTSNKTVTGIVEISVNGRVEDTIDFNISSGLTRGKSLTINTDLGAGEEADFQVCADISESDL